MQIKIDIDNSESWVRSGLKLRGKSARFELPGKFMKVSYNDSLSD